MRRCLTRLALAALVLGMALAPARATAEDEDAATARRFVDALKAGDAAALTAMVDFERRSAERVARYLEPQLWSQLDPTERATKQEYLILDWIEYEPYFNRHANIVAILALEDPDAGLGPVPDRRILRIVASNPFAGQLCDLLITLAPDRRVIEFDQGTPYRAGANPDGEEGRRPRVLLNAPPPDQSTWSPDVTDAERDTVIALVEALLAAEPGPALANTRQQLHAHPRPAVAAMIERLADLDRQPTPDALAQAMLVTVLQQITGHPTPWLATCPPDMDEATWRQRNRESVRDWCCWHTTQGWIFEAQPTPAATALAAGPVAPAPPAKAGKTAGGKAKPPTPAPARRETTRDILFPAAADLKLTFKGQAATGREVESQLGPALKEALNEWAEVCKRFDLAVISSGSPDYLIVGRAPPDALETAGKSLSAAWDLLDPVLPVAAGKPPRTVVAVILDEPAMKSAAYAGLVDDLVARRVLLEDTAAEMRMGPTGLLRRQAPLFIQPTWDITGEGEFRFDNEVAGKFAQCLATTRCGELPRLILWGLDYVVEMRLYGTVYQFDTEGFVYTADHFDWPVRTKQMLEKAAKARKFSFGAVVAKQDDAGTATEAQMITWALLEWLRQERPAELGKLLKDLAALQAATGPRSATTWTPPLDATVQTLSAALDGIDAAALQAWLDAK